MKKLNKIIAFITLSLIAIYFICYDKIVEGHGGGGGGRIDVGRVSALGRGRGVFNRGIGYGRGLGSAGVGYGLGRYYVDNNYDDLGYYANPFYIYPRFPFLYQ